MALANEDRPVYMVGGERGGGSRARDCNVPLDAPEVRRYRPCD
jgi:hypothetical protein